MKRELFGQEECPIMYRWRLLSFGDQRGKLMLHWFLPGRSEPDFHDHPRDFLTVVLWGHYLDVRLNGDLEVVAAPTVRFRRAEHTHRTVAGKRGCLTVALFLRRRREWGFWRD